MHNFRYTIMLTPQQYYTILFVMSCLRIQSTKGRKVESDPNDTQKTVKAKKNSKPVKKPKNTLVDQKTKEEKLKKNSELTASDIAERMTKDLPRSVVKYYRVIISDEYVQIIDTKNQPFRPLLNDVKFHEFMKQKKSPQKKSGQKKRRVSECEWSEEPSDEGVVEHGPHKSLRAGVETTPHEGMAFAPIQEDQPTQQEPEVDGSTASIPTLEGLFTNLQRVLETDPEQFYQVFYPYMPLYEVHAFNSWLEYSGSATRVVVNLAQSDDFNVLASMQYEQTSPQVPASQDYSANQLWSTGQMMQHSTVHVLQSPVTQTLLEGMQAINNDTSQQGYTATLGTPQYYGEAQVPAAYAQPFEDDALGVTLEDLSQSTVQLTSFDGTLASQPLHDFESYAFVGGYANPLAAGINATN